MQSPITTINFRTFSSFPKKISSPVISPPLFLTSFLRLRPLLMNIFSKYKINMPILKKNSFICGLEVDGFHLIEIYFRTTYFGCQRLLMVLNLAITPGGARDWTGLPIYKTNKYHNPYTQISTVLHSVAMFYSFYCWLILYTIIIYVHIIIY